MTPSILCAVDAVTWSAVEASWTTMLDWGQRCRIHFEKDSCRRISEFERSRDTAASLGPTTDILVSAALEYQSISLPTSLHDTDITIVSKALTMIRRKPTAIAITPDDLTIFEEERLRKLERENNGRESAQNGIRVNFDPSDELKPLPGDKARIVRSREERIGIGQRT